MEPPKYILSCSEEKALADSIDSMLDSVSDNIDEGYKLDIELLAETIQAGITLSTFNMLVLNLNRELNAQYECGYGYKKFVTTGNSSTIH